MDTQRRVSKVFVRLFRKSITLKPARHNCATARKLKLTRINWPRKMQKVETTRSLWRNPDFTLLWCGQLVSQFGSRISTLALPLLVLALTNSPAQTGFIAAVEALPYLLLSLPGGALIDQLNRKAIMIWCDIARIIAFGSIPVVFVFGKLDLPQLYMVALVAGITKVLFDITVLAALPNVVGAAQFSKAASLTFVGEQLAKLGGPTLGGILIGFGKTTVAGTVLAYLVDTITYLFSVVSLMFIKVPFQTQQQAQKLNSLWSNILEGLRFVWSQKHLRWMAILITCSNFLLSSLLITIVVLCQTRLGADTWLVGLTLSSAGLGGLIGAVATPPVLARFKPMEVFFGTLAAWTVTVVIIAQASTIWWVMAGFLLWGLVDMVFSINVITYRARLTPDHLQGRVISSFRVMTYGIEPLGLAVGGTLLGIIGANELLWLMAGGLVLCSIASGFLIKSPN